MKKLENNIWNIFYILTFTSLLVFAFLLYLEYKHLVKKVEFELDTNVQLVATSLSYKLAEQEILLESLGKELLRSKHSYAEKQKLLDQLLVKYPTLAGFGLLDKDGKFIVTSSNIKVKSGTDLLQDDSIRHYFTQTLQSNYMVVGETRYFKALGRWVIPLRKAIRDESGNVIGVMTTGFVNEKKKNFMDQLYLLSKYSIVIVREKNHNGDFFRQYVSGFDALSEEKLYLEALDKSYLKKIKERLHAKYGYSLSDIRKERVVVNFKGRDILGHEQLMAMTYDKRYRLWIIVKRDVDALMGVLQRSLIIYIGIFILFFGVLFWLFKMLANSEGKSKKNLVFQAEHDELTLLPNRKYMYKHIDSWAKRNAEGFYVLYLDLDNFKNINDKFGHTIGDKILQEVAKRLESFFASSDMLIRQGGDEFIVFLTYGYKEQLDLLCRSLIQKISEVYVVDKNEFRIGISIGISTYLKDSTNIEELLSFADTAMYKAKKHKNYYAFFSEDMRHETLLKSDIEHELRGAIESDELFLNYQPQIDKDAKLCGVEALLRWNNKKLGFVSPDRFISVAEQTGMMDDIGDFVINRAMQEIKSLQNKTKTSFTLSINISMVQFMESNFLENMMAFIAKNGFDKSLLTLEVTESLSVAELDKIVPLLESIQAEGIDVSLDDFGTGYSSLSVLQKLPISELKIDKSFIDEIAYDSSERKLVQSIIEIGKNFGMQTVAEGVESQEQLKILRDLGCDIIQGYFYSKPLTLEQLYLYVTKEQ